MEKHKRAVGSLVIAALILALLALVTAQFLGVGCASCGQAASLYGDVSVGAVGILVYTILIVMVSWESSKRAKLAWSAVTLILSMATAGVHSALVYALYRNQIVCVPCLLAAGGSVVANALLLSFVPRSRLIGLAVIPIVALGAHLGGKRLQAEAKASVVRAARSAERQLALETDGSIAPGSAKMVVYVREGCAHCAHFRSDVTERVLSEFKSKLSVEERPAWKRMVSPTTVILGQTPTVMIGVRPLLEVRSAIKAAMGYSHPHERVDEALKENARAVRR